MTPKQIDAAVLELSRLRGISLPGALLIIRDAICLQQAMASGLAVRELVSLEEHNERVQREREAMRVPRGNGIKCPQCSAELIDTGIRSSNGYQSWQEVSCRGCDWRGSRAA